MRPERKRNVLGVMVDAVEPAEAVSEVLEAARAGRPLSVSALAVHGVMTGVGDPEHRFRLNRLDLVCPDGQPVRWAINLLYGDRLEERVYGPDLMLSVCAAAAAEGLGVYFHGSTEATLGRLANNLRRQFPALVIAGSGPSRFRRLDASEEDEVVDKVRASGARILFAGLGCPRQEVFAYELRDRLSLPILAVGAAFSFHAGELSQAPPWMQRRGLEWLYRLGAEPGRLWRRYLLLNPAYAALLTAQRLGLRDFSPEGSEPAEALRYG